MFTVEFTSKAEKDLDKLKDSSEAYILVSQTETELGTNPFPHGKKIKKIRGISYDLFRLRLDTKRDSYRVFYLIKETKIIVLRIIPKKEADRVIKNYF